MTHSGIQKDQEYRNALCDELIRQSQNSGTYQRMNGRNHDGGIIGILPGSKLQLSALKVHKKVLKNPPDT